jgi:hypothetical protein
VINLSGNDILLRSLKEKNHNLSVLYKVYVYDAKIQN